MSTSFLQAPLAPLGTLCSWLDGMEELQASQGPLAADASLAASQLREQEVQGPPGDRNRSGGHFYPLEPQIKSLVTNGRYHVLEYNRSVP